MSPLRHRSGAGRLPPAPRTSGFVRALFCGESTAIRRRTRRGDRPPGRRVRRAVVVALTVASAALGGCGTGRGGDDAADPWRPRPGATVHWQLQGKVSLRHDAEVYDVDLFDAVPSPRRVNQLPVDVDFVSAAGFGGASMRSSAFLGRSSIVDFSTSTTRFEPAFAA